MRLVAFLAAACGLVLLWALGAGEALRLSGLADHWDRLTLHVAARPVASGALYVLLYCLVTGLGAPGAALLTLAGGALFGAAAGALLAIMGATAGGTLLFLGATSSLGRWLRPRIDGSRLERFARGFREDAASYLLFLRLVAVFPFFIVNLAAALIGVPFRTFLWTTAIGIAPASLLYAFAGSGVDGALAALRADRAACLAAQGPDCAVVFSPLALLRPELLVALGGLGLLALTPVLFKRMRKKRDADRLAG